MKIILIHYRYYDASGPETYLFNVTKMLTDKGHEVIPFSLDYAKNKKSDYSKYFPKPVIENFHFNNAVASIRTLFNAIVGYKTTNQRDEFVIVYSIKNLLILINPMVPHISEELWETLDSSTMICNKNWPIVNNDFIQTNIVEIPIQVNGKIRALINVPLNTDKKELEFLAFNEVNVKKFLNGQPKKVIIIINKIVNFVV